MERLGHSAIATRVTTECLGGPVEIDPFRSRGIESLTGLGGIELVLDGRKDLEPQLPGDDDALGTAVASERDRCGANTLTFELGDDLGELRPGFGRGKDWWNSAARQCARSSTVPLSPTWPGATVVMDTTREAALK